jgi:hypothetical protein
MVVATHQDWVQKRVSHQDCGDVSCGVQGWNSCIQRWQVLTGIAECSFGDAW